MLVCALCPAILFVHRARGWRLKPTETHRPLCSVLGGTCFVCCAEKAAILFVKLSTSVDNPTCGFISFPIQTQIILLALKDTKSKILAVFQVFIDYFLSASKAEILIEGQ